MKLYDPFIIYLSKSSTFNLVFDNNLFRYLISSTESIGMSEKKSLILMINGAKIHDFWILKA